jgi:L-lysine exporter family protein LysE/ArgO
MASHIEPAQVFFAPGIAVSGFLFGISLIAAIGAQNAYILKQALLKNHVPMIIIFCSLADILLISAGIFGMGRIFRAHPSLEKAIGWAGAIFLFGYAAFSFYRAYSGAGFVIDGSKKDSQKKVLTTLFAFTFLNPHVYIDTMALMGTVAHSVGEKSLASFTIGACVASITWFVLVGYGARYLRPLFASKKSWRILECCIGVAMTAIAMSLVAHVA